MPTGIITAGTRKRKDLDKPDGMTDKEHWRYHSKWTVDEEGDMVPTAVDDVVVPSLPTEKDDGDEDYKVEDGEDESEKGEDEDEESDENRVRMKMRRVTNTVLRSSHLSLS